MNNACEYVVDPIKQSEWVDLIHIWEASVRATHHFLKEEDIEYFKPLILKEYFKAVELWGVRNTNKKVTGFLGVANQGLEMLFIHPDLRGKGIGKMLLSFAINQLKVKKVDVNEDNEQAVGFYLHHGFKVKRRSPLDGTGKAYPILHMELAV